MLRVFNCATHIPLTKAVVSYETSNLRADEGVVFIVPEVVKASAERIMFDSFESAKAADDIKTDFGPVMLGSLNREIISFNRLAVRLLSMVGMETSTDTSLLRNVIYRVLMEKPADFPLLTKLASRFEYIDMLVDGEFVLELKNPKLRFRGSENQRIIKVKESLASDNVVLWDDTEGL